MPHLSTADIIPIENGEPVIQDIRLAEVLGYKAPRQIRELIQRNMDELSRWGPLVSTEECNQGFSRTARQNQRGRPGVSYLLNEGQSVTVTVLSKTEKAAAARHQIITTFLQYRRGELSPTANENLPSRLPAPVDERTRIFQEATEIRMIWGPTAAGRHLIRNGI